VETVKEQESLLVEVFPRKNSKPICSCCGQDAPGYDCNSQQRQFQFVPIWGYQVYLLYAMRRVECPDCGVKVERVPWAEGKSPLTCNYQIFLAKWAQRMSWKETARAFRVTWDSVFVSVRWFVEYGLRHRSLEGIEAIGVDEWQWRRGHDYVTVVYQIDENCRRLLYVTKNRNIKSLLRFFRMIGPEASAKIKYVCSDMLPAYLKVIKKKVPNALNILDRFHIVVNLNKVMNEVRAGEARRMRQEGFEEVLTHSKYCFLKNPENLTEKQNTKLENILQYDLKSVRAYLLKEAFQIFWTYHSPYWAGWYLDKWCTRAMRSKLHPFKKFVKSIRKHRPLIMNYFKAKKQFSSGSVEGLNRKINLTTRKAFGFRTFEALEIALFHTMGELPEPKSTHTFF
jgi:transposase